MATATLARTHFDRTLVRLAIAITHSLARRRNIRCHLMAYSTKNTPARHWRGGMVDEALMCRNIKTLYNFAPPATQDEIRASSLQFVRKLSGFARPSRQNEQAFNRAVDQVTEVVHELLATLVTNAPPRDREVEAAKAKARSAERFASGRG
jgi:hypothetical protein